MCSKNGKRRILFLTGTRADFGKLKPLMHVAEANSCFEIQVFVTGMHMLARYGSTVEEVKRCGFKNLHTYINQRMGDAMDAILAKSITGLSDFVKEDRPDLIVVHGDRVEALSGAIVGSLNNILVAHIEGGEVSGTIDELIRHATSKLAHIHFVANTLAKQRLEQMGESSNSIHVIGSPDIDIMLSHSLPDLNRVKQHYGIDFSSYGILLFHPVTTELNYLDAQVRNLVDAVIDSGHKFVIILPNNDHGSDVIFKELERLRDKSKYLIYPSIRFEYFLTLLKHASFILGNSSSGVREAPLYGVPCINVGSRQHGRADAELISNVEPVVNDIVRAIGSVSLKERRSVLEFGEGNSTELFLKIITATEFWERPTQKVFVNRR